MFSFTVTYLSSDGADLLYIRMQYTSLLMPSNLQITYMEMNGIQPPYKILDCEEPNILECIKKM